jgi:rare lipoprotein A
MKNLSIILVTFLCSFSSSESIYKGTATYYGENYTGRLTASGEKFYKDSLTAAHKYFKFGTVVKITNLANDSTRLVKINDRLPKSSKHIIDLSYGCAKELNFIRRGVIPVTFEIVDTVPIKK